LSDGALPHRRLFIGLVPDTGTRAALIEHQRRWHWPRGSRPTRPASLHLTLHFLDEVDVIHESALRDALAAERTAPFDLVLRTTQCWSGGIAVLRPDPNVVLDNLHERIAARLVDVDVMPPRSAWTPHITLARDAHHCALPEAAAPIVWSVVDFALVWSRRTAPIGHEVLERYGR
jgi:2'-5' RNA ligase